MSSDGADASSGDDFDFKLYRYTPSLPAAIVSVAVFSILTGIHLWRMFRARAFYFTPFVIGGVRKFLPVGTHVSVNDYLPLTFRLQSR